ncbi:MAG: hypothetical protein V7754_06765 [Halioglobus sp.]
MLTYDALLERSRSKKEAQRILFVFAETAGRMDGQGNRGDFSITPVMFIDKELHELNNFPGLVEDTKQTGKSWDLVFIAGLLGKENELPSFSETDQQLDTMVKAINQGEIERFAVYKSDGSIADLAAGK